MSKIRNLIIGSKTTSFLVPNNIIENKVYTFHIHQKRILEIYFTSVILGCPSSFIVQINNENQNKIFD